MNFSDRDQRIIAVALTLLCFLFIALMVVGGLSLVGWFLLSFSNVIMPLAAAAIVALIMQPYYAWVHEHTGRHMILSVSLVYLSLLIPIGIVLWFFGSLLVEQVSELSQSVGGYLRDAWKQLEVDLPAFLESSQENADGNENGDSGMMGSLSEGAGGLLHAAFVAGKNIFSMAMVLLGWVVFPVYLAFFLAVRLHEGGEFGENFPFLKPRVRQDISFLVREFVHILVTFFRGRVVVALLEGGMYGIGFLILGLRYGLVLGILLGIMNIVPFLGSILGLAITLPIAYLQEDGGWTLVFLTVFVFALVQAIESYYLTPKIMGHRTGLHPVTIIVSILFWGSVFSGIWGMIVAIPLTAFLVVFWRLLRDKYLGWNKKAV